MHPWYKNLKLSPKYSRLPEAFYSRVKPEPAPDPKLVAFSPEAAALIGFSPELAQDPDFLKVMSGGLVPDGFDPIAEVYAGHQFGSWVPRLGDGRAILLTEALGPDGRRWDLHLKGAGLTPYSRMGDGRAVLRSCIREFLGSEAMYGLGVPTTRALCVVGSSEPVHREELETRALLLRMAPHHVRMGTFEYFYRRGEKDRLRELCAFAMDCSVESVDADSVCEWFREVVASTAKLMAHWQAVGFEHGVMNTDNLSVLGITLDYGPFGFMDQFDPSWICNHSDELGRYAYDQQPGIALWNLRCLAQALVPLLGESFEEARDRAIPELERYEIEFHTAYSERMREKFGLFDGGEGDASLMSDGLTALAAARGDFTLFFRRLSGLGPNSNWVDLGPELRDEAMRPWIENYIQRLRELGPSVDEARRARMNRANPKYILRNYLAHQAIQKSVAGDHSEVEKLRQILSRPYDEQPEHEEYAKPSPDWGRHLEISCSS